mmetsp:Transcript_78225/g.181506  ORF Transcript_78225/g.181506 Transcript_78225/m.181506 type:complete len:97 (-) Transcript_78225:34-324(-)
MAQVRPSGCRGWSRARIYLAALPLLRWSGALDALATIEQQTLGLSGWAVRSSSPTPCHVPGQSMGSHESVAWFTELEQVPGSQQFDESQHELAMWR